MIPPEEFSWFTAISAPCSSPWPRGAKGPVSGAIVPTLIDEAEDADEEEEVPPWGELLLVLPQAAAAAEIAAATSNAPVLLRMSLLPPCLLGRRLAAALGCASPGWGRAERRDQRPGQCRGGRGRDRPDAVSVSHGGSIIRAVGAGPATITATVMYRGRIATGTFVVYVQ